MVPPEFQRLLWRVYVPGQEVSKDPSPEYVAVQRCCVALILIRETGDAAGLERFKVLIREAKPYAEAAGGDWVAVIKGALARWAASLVPQDSTTAQMGTTKSTT